MYRRWRYNTGGDEVAACAYRRWRYNTGGSGAGAYRRWRYNTGSGGGDEVAGGAGSAGDGVRGGFLRIIASEPGDDGDDALSARNNTIIGGPAHSAGAEMNIE